MYSKPFLYPGTWTGLSDIRHTSSQSASFVRAERPNCFSGEVVLRKEAENRHRGSSPIDRIAQVNHIVCIQAFRRAGQRRPRVSLLVFPCFPGARILPLRVGLLHFNPEHFCPCQAMYFLRNALCVPDCKIFQHAAYIVLLCSRKICNEYCHSPLLPSRFYNTGKSLAAESPVCYYFINLKFIVWNKKYPKIGLLISFQIFGTSLCIILY